jgi:L-fucose isomerase-like protein
MLPEEEMFVENAASFVRVCNIIKGFKGANIGLVNPRPERFETCIFSEDALIRKFQQRVVPTSLPDLLSKANDSEELKTAIPQIQKQMMKEADLSAVNNETQKKIISLEYALKQFAAEKKLSAMGVQCWTAMQSVYGISPCYAMGRLTDQGIMASCEVDIYGALTMLIQYLASGSATPPHFIDWTIQHQKQDNVFLAWHCGNGPPSLAAKGSKVNVSYHSILGESLGIDRSFGTGEFQIKPGEVTLCRLHESEGEFKMLVSTGEIQPSNQQLRGSWSWVKVADLDKLYTTLVSEGFTHHASLIHGNYARVIADACQILGIRIVTV